MKPLKRLVVGLFCAAAAASAPGQATANPQYRHLAGSWRCDMNSVPATVQLFANLRPDQTLTAQGTLILNGTSGYHQFSGASGRWAVGRNEFGQIVVQMQVIPRNYASFSIFAGITADPGILYSRIPDYTTGGQVETACRRSAN